ncbi:hypothetical protein TNCV_4896351 [Trichonephila clavipes]|uniref:Uncharacterized protein n=1 Tax=Trichonephila clavipes TaxID=2585209 RepID=A0A8X6VWW4_TRICX|nr:hypothetical protein TNCV_4896351 [Trichonephila clavipes]
MKTSSVEFISRSPNPLPMKNSPLVSMEIPLRTAYGQNGRCGMQPKAKHSLRAQAQLMRTETVETFELVKVLDESRSFFRVHTGYFSNIPKCIKAEFIASWACSQSSVVSSSKR